MLQNELAAQSSKDGNLKRVIWLPTNTSSENEQHQVFIEALHQDAEAQAGAVLITGGLEELKSTIYRKLKVIKQASSSQGEKTELPEGEGKQLVYLVCDVKDRKPTVPLRKWLIDHGMEVKLPLFAGEATAVREANENLLATCDAVLLYYGAGDEAWKHAIDSDHRKIRAYRGAKPLPARTTYLAEPLEEHLFFGREHQVDAMVNKLAQRRFLAGISVAQVAVSPRIEVASPALRAADIRLTLLEARDDFDRQAKGSGMETMVEELGKAFLSMLSGLAAESKGQLILRVQDPRANLVRVEMRDAHGAAPLASRQRRPPSDGPPCRQ